MPPPDYIVGRNLIWLVLLSVVDAGEVFNLGLRAGEEGRLVELRGGCSKGPKKWYKIEKQKINQSIHRVSAHRRPTLRAFCFVSSLSQARTSFGPPA